MTVILSTFVVGLGTETELRIGVVPDVNGIMTDALLLMKVTPGDSGLSSETVVLEGAPMNVAWLMYCGLVIPIVE